MIRVLIVDDDKLARKGLISIMPWGNWGMEVVGEAANGLKALEFLAEHEVDLMFVDISMPIMSGIELMKQAQPLYPALRFVVLTFHEDFDYVQTCIRLGALDYISKLKMETEDYNAIFEQIAQRMTEIAKQNGRDPAGTMKPGTGDADGETIPSEESESSREAANALDRKWRILKWLFDDILFDALCRETELSHIPPKTIAMTCSRALLHAEEATHVTAPSGLAMDTARMAVAAIRSYRDHLYGLAARSTDLTETAICMLKSSLYIREHIAEPLHTDLVAGHVNMSRSYFCQCFKRMFGQTFNEYIRLKRIHLAKQYLMKTQQPISWISQAVGYGDIKYFSHVFREQERMLPSEYRGRHLDGSV